jgi:hypothetical protein
MPGEQVKFPTNNFYSEPCLGSVQLKAIKDLPVLQSHPMFSFLCNEERGGLHPENKINN